MLGMWFEINDNIESRKQHKNKTKNETFEGQVQRLIKTNLVEVIFLWKEPSNNVDTLHYILLVYGVYLTGRTTQDNNTTASYVLQL